MPVSFNRTRTQIATMVLAKLGIGARGQTQLSADTDLVYEAMDMRLKEMHRLGIFWRKVETVPLTFSVGSGIISASATIDILFPISLTFTNGSNDDPMEIISPLQYAKIEDKSQTGNPQRAVWDRSAKFTLWPIPVADGTMKLLYEKVADDTSAGAVIDIDVSMLRWMRDILCYDCGDYFRKDDNLMMRYKAEAEIAEKNIRKLNNVQVDYAPVAVDDWSTTRGSRESDYGM